MCDENEISYELVLAVMYLESRFDVEAVNYANSNGTRDYGLMQINSRYKDVHAENAGIDNFNVFDPYENIKVGINVLVTERNYWREYGMCEMEVFKYFLSSYNAYKVYLNINNKNQETLSDFAIKNYDQ